VKVGQAVGMDPRAVIRMNPTEGQAAAGGQARFTFAVIERRAVAYSVESAVSSWCRLLLPAGQIGLGELVVDVPDDAGPGRYALRVVATASGQEIAAANVTLRIAGERRLGREPCLEVLPRPKFNLQPDGSVVVTLQVVNCGNVDVNLVLQAHHEDGWSFSVDEPQLIVGVQQRPITVKVTLRPPARHGVDRGDQITVEVNAGTGWQSVQGRVPRRIWPWVAAGAAALVVAAGVAAAVLASSDESDDNVAVTDDGTVTEETTVPPSTEETTEPVPEPPQILSLTVDASQGCDITVAWVVTGDGERLELIRDDGKVINDSLPVESGSEVDSLSGEGTGEFTYELIAHDFEDVVKDRMTASDTGSCVQ
jgi:hypothetical protein